LLDYSKDVVTVDSIDMLDLLVQLVLQMIVHRQLNLGLELVVFQDGVASVVSLESTDLLVQLGGLVVFLVLPLAVLETYHFIYYVQVLFLIL
jgi:hypothetical protein